MVDTSIGDIMFGDVLLGTLNGKTSVFLGNNSSPSRSSNAWPSKRLLAFVLALSANKLNQFTKDSGEYPSQHKSSRSV